mgnify:CR=1 FL=1
MKVIIVSPEKTLYDAEVNGVKLPGTKGRFEILKGHAPIISTLSVTSLIRWILAVALLRWRMTLFQYVWKRHKCFSTE